MKKLLSSCMLKKCLTDFDLHLICKHWSIDHKLNHLFIFFFFHHLFLKNYCNFFMVAIHSSQHVHSVQIDDIYEKKGCNP
jgi:hypothetical protein